jgi:predicted unusual protein kinase regulating ubiquinone biosynthesis (AarF/ABC1/UbiB family)
MLKTLFKLFVNFSAYFLYLKTFKNENKYLAECIIYHIKQGGNVFWKLTQLIYSRVEFQYNLKNNYLITELKKFYDQCPTHEFSFSKKIIERLYSDTIDNIFEKFDETPIASGSIAQVYRATLKDGKEVAIKVRHPNIRENIMKLCKYIKYIPKSLIRFDLNGLDKYLLNQTDFNIEYINLEKFRKKFKDVSYLHFPIPYLAEEDIIVMEYIEGKNIDEVYNECEDNYKKEHWETMIKFWMFLKEKILIKNIIHSDLHKGNWKINNGKLIIYDFGIIIDKKKYCHDIKKIWEGFEYRECSYYIPIVVKNILNKNKPDNEIIADMNEFMNNRIDFESEYNIEDIMIIFEYININGYILKFFLLSFLLSLNIYINNFKNFSFTSLNKCYLEKQLRIINILKEKCDFYNNYKLKKKVNEDEILFLKYNKERLKKIFDKKNKNLEHINLDDFSEESDLESDFI